MKEKKYSKTSSHLVKHSELTTLERMGVSVRMLIVQAGHSQKVKMQRNLFCKQVLFNLIFRQNKHHF